MIRKAFTKLLVLLVEFYRVAISPYFPSSCRYQPTCSTYAIEALKKHGPLKGLWLALGRIGRCHPWSEGGHDPVPDSTPSSCAPSKDASQHSTF